MDRDRILEVAKNENNDELSNKNYTTAKLISRTVPLIVLCILAMIEYSRYPAIVWIMLIPINAMYFTDSLIRVIYKKADKVDFWLTWLMLFALLFCITMYIIEFWL